MFNDANKMFDADSVLGGQFPGQGRQIEMFLNFTDLKISSFHFCSFA